MDDAGEEHSAGFYFALPSRNSPFATAMATWDICVNRIPPTPKMPALTD